MERAATEISSRDRRSSVADKANVPQKNRAHAVHNPLTHYREAISVDEILSARSIVELS
jgi:hypothetical protein